MRLSFNASMPDDQVQDLIDAGTQQGPYKPSPRKLAVAGGFDQSFGTLKRKRDR